MALQLDGLVPLLQVFDMPEAVAFYRDVLGFEMVEHSPEVEAAEGRFFHWCWLRRGSAELMLNTLYDAGERPPIRDPMRAERLGDICLYMGSPDVDAAHLWLVSNGVECDPPVVTGYGMKQLYFRDRDGYGLCIQMRA
ncbi:VOC family protein [Sphingomonas sp.]|uniref:VOC family protein n=1 Tax=Sphingomonas sp. TaxID=28214 RepID=UPI001B19FC29|nr:VOC family protein [Sphingomonas sp.]MBO9711408.1 VOC family protein [Sphingomonas sp.]